MKQIYGPSEYEHRRRKRNQKKRKEQFEAEIDWM